MEDHNLGAENSHTRYIDKLEAELAQLRTDNAVLAMEVRAWRSWSKRNYKSKYGPHGTCEATDTSGALERARGTKP